MVLLVAESRCLSALKGIQVGVWASLVSGVVGLVVKTNRKDERVFRDYEALVLKEKSCLSSSLPPHLRARQAKKVD